MYFLFEKSMKNAKQSFKNKVAHRPQTPTARQQNTDKNRANATTGEKVSEFLDTFDGFEQMKTKVSKNAVKNAVLES